jgi:hypothetical protein
MRMIATVMDPAQISMERTCVCVTLATLEMERTVQILMSAPATPITVI